MAGYDAFISYSHAADGNLAPALQSGLQRLAKPWQKRRALEVFRDRTGLAVTPHLWSEISVALGQSRWLVLLASPDSASSKWVNQEIEFFLAQDPTARDRILPVVTGGEWQWAGDGTFTADSTSVPASLHGVFVDEPLYLDLRWAKDRTDLSLHDAVFRAAVADVAAPIHGKSKDELVGEDVHQFRLARRVRRAAVVSLAALTIGALVASVVAVSKSREAVRQQIFAEGETKRAEAETQRANNQTRFAEGETKRAEAETERANDQTDIAIANADDARSRELAASAIGLTADDPAVAALLAVESLYPNDVKVARETPESINAIGVTSRALLSRIFVSAGSLPDATGQAIVATSGEYVATIGSDENAACWPAFENGAPVATPISWWNKDTGKQLPGVPPTVQLATAFINTDWGVMRIDDALTVTPVVGRPTCDGISPTYREPAVYDGDSKLIVAFETLANQFVTLDPTTMVVQSRMTPLDDPSVTWVDVTASSNLVIATKSDGNLRVWGVKEGGSGTDFALAKPAATLSTSGGVVFGGEGLVDLNRDAATSNLPGVFDYVSFALFSADTRFLALIDGSCGCRAGIWDVSLPSLPSLVSVIASTYVSSLRWLDNTLVLTSARGVEFYKFLEPQITRNAVMVSADGSTAVTYVPLDGSLEVRSLADQAGTPTHPLEQAGVGLSAISADGQLVSFASNGDYVSDGSGGFTVVGSTLTVTELSSGAEVFRRDHALQRTVFDPSGRFMLYSYPLDPTVSGIVALRAPQDESVVEIYDTRRWERVAAGRISAELIGSLRWTSQTELIGQSWVGELQVVTITDGGLTVTQPVADISGQGWWSSPDRQLLVSADGAGRLRVLTGLGGSQPPMAYPTVDVGIAPVESVVFSADGQRMVTVAATSIDLWDVSVPSNVRRVEQLDQLPIATYEAGVYGYGFGAQFLPDGRSLLLFINGNLIELADYDPQRVCEAVSEADLERAEKVMGNTSACRDHVQAA